MNFIGRDHELEFLEKRYQSEGGQLIVLYGRRRVGKTELLRRFCADKPHVFYSSKECSNAEQLREFSAALLEKAPRLKRYVGQAFPSWNEAFESSADLPFGNAKKLLIIDEFPYMCKGDTSIPSTLQNLWDSRLKDENIMIILCGSSMSFMEKDVLSEKNPLYGRATGIYKLEPLGFYDAKKFFPNYTPEELCTAYAVLGGMPHYLRQFDPKLSLGENIRENILSKGSVLYSEAEFMLRQEFREVSTYNSIIEAISFGQTRVSEIAALATDGSVPTASIYLKNLIELGLCERLLSEDAGIKSQANKNRGIYRIKDPFFRFWYRFVFSNLSSLENGDAHGVYRQDVEPNLHDFTSYAFEDICREYMWRLQKNGELPFRFDKLGRWFGKTTVRDKGGLGGLRTAETEIDIFAYSKRQKKYLLGECKYRNRAFSYEDLLNLQAKLASLRDGKNRLYYAVFSSGGFGEKVLALKEASDDLLLYGLEDVVKG